MGAIGLAMVACGEVPTSASVALEGLRVELAAYDLSVEVEPESVALLAWQVPRAACPHAYRVSSSVDPPLLHEAASLSTLAMVAAASASPPAAGPSGPGEVVALDVYYRGLRAEKRGLVREGHASAEFLGPASPTAACMARTWDPVEDAFSLGWPRLPGRLTAVGESWTGLRVEGKCNASACVDPQTGAGGPDNHHLSCVTMSWRETLVGVYEIAGQRLALVTSHWDDGHAGAGQESNRTTLLSIDDGRPVWSKTTLEHRFPELRIDNSFGPVTRTWVLESADTCPGSLAALGFTRRPDDVAEVTAALAELADIEALRERERRTTRPREAAEPFGSAEPLGPAELRGPAGPRGPEGQ